MWSPSACHPWGREAVSVSRIAWENGQGAALRLACERTGIALVDSILDIPTTEAAYREAIANVSRQGANAIMVGDNPGLDHQYTAFGKVVSGMDVADKIVALLK